MNSTGNIIVSREGKMTLITINRPQCSNALDWAAQEELSRVFDFFHEDPDQWVAILTGSGGRAFCAGMDLKAVAAGGDRSLPKSGFGGITYRFDLDKPVIAAVNGACVGGGFEMALACDLIIASENARFGLPEPIVGTAALAGGLQRLPRQIGLKQAMDMILTARLVDADEAYRLGFVNNVVPIESLLDTAREKAAQIIALNQASIRVSKRCVMEGMTESSVRLAIARQLKIPQVQALLGSADRHDGAINFK